MKMNTKWRKGTANPNNKYYLFSNREQSKFNKTVAEKDLGVLFNNELKFTQHTELQVNKGMKMEGLIRRSLEYLNKELFSYLFKSLIQTHIEYSMPI